MARVTEFDATLSDCYQVMVPAPIRHALKLRKGDAIRYEIRPSGEVVLSKCEAPTTEDPALGQFLSFLSRDIASNPERIQFLDVLAVRSAKALVADVRVDLDDALSKDDE